MRRGRNWCYNWESRLLAVWGHKKFLKLIWEIWTFLVKACNVNSSLKLLKRKWELHREYEIKICSIKLWPNFSVRWVWLNFREFCRNMLLLTLLILLVKILHIFTILLNLLWNPVSAIPVLVILGTHMCETHPLCGHFTLSLDMMDTSTPKVGDTRWQKGKSLVFLGTFQLRSIFWTQHQRMSSVC